MPDGGKGGAAAAPWGRGSARPGHGVCAPAAVRGPTAAPAPREETQEKEPAVSIRAPVPPHALFPPRGRWSPAPGRPEGAGRARKPTASGEAVPGLPRWNELGTGERRTRGDPAGP